MRVPTVPVDASALHSPNARALRQTSGMTALETLIANLTVGELARFAGRSVEDVVTVALGQTNGQSPAATRHTGTRPGRDSVKVPRGGLRIDHVLSTLQSLGEPVKLEEVRARVGGSAQQVRSALQRLSESGTVKITGERRGTRYAAR